LRRVRYSFTDARATLKGVTMLEFYTNPMSRGQIARWMVEEVGQPYEERLVE